MGKLGFLARTSEICRLGARARVVRQTLHPLLLDHSFAALVREGGMDRGRGRPPRCFGDSARGWIGGKRSVPDGRMEEDDLMVEDDLRAKLRKDQD